MAEKFNGLNYNFIEGSGTPLVFLHGWLDLMDSWKPVIDCLELENPVLLYDQRCHGRSECSEFTFEGLAEDLESLLDHLGIENAVLIGHSMGGMVALQFAVQNPERVSKLFLAASCASTPEPEGKSPKYFLENLGSMDRERWAEEIMENYTGGGELDERREKSKKVLVNADRTPVECGLREMVEFDIRLEVEERLSGKDAMVVAGKDDGAITLDKCRELSDLLDCPLKVLDSTHLMLQERSEELGEFLEKFL
ncbi:MAG: alpha/beta hydrolase [Candidatus Nanohaloarchaea archaeon]|nr:alpha/beta hydrolase [Candidatus Nanohaloarchaea archaeon]